MPSECHVCCDIFPTNACHVYCQACWTPIESPESHMCDKDRVQYVAEVQKQFIQCVACRTVVEKQSGCSHMYCTQCHVGWDDQGGHGTLLRGIIMNPHYFDALAVTSEAEVPGYMFGSPGDMDVDVNRWPSYQADVLVYHGLCAYVFHEVLCAYHTGDWQEVRRAISETYPHIHKLNDVFAGRDDPEGLKQTRQWADHFHRHPHRTQHYSRIMFDWRFV